MQQLPIQPAVDGPTADIRQPEETATRRQAAEAGAGHASGPETEAKVGDVTRVVTRGKIVTVGRVKPTNMIPEPPGMSANKAAKLLNKVSYLAMHPAKGAKPAKAARPTTPKK